MQDYSFKNVNLRVILASLPIHKRFSSQRSRKMAAKALEHLDGNMKILDFGCGNCFTAEEILRQKPSLSITGLDVIKDQNLHRISGNFNFVQYTGGALPFDDNIFDAVMAISSMHHTENPEYYLSEMKRVIKPGGFILLIEEMYINLPDKIWISAQDWVLNKLKKGVPVPLTFRSREHYLRQFDLQELKVVNRYYVRPGFPWMHHYVFKLAVNG